MLGALYETLAVASGVVLKLRKCSFENKNIGVILPSILERQKDHLPGQFILGKNLPEWADYTVMTGSFTERLAGTNTISEAGTAGPNFAVDGPRATAGAVMATLIRLGVEEDEAEIFTIGVQRGRILVIVRADPSMVQSANTVMRSSEPIRIISHLSGILYSYNTVVDALSG